MFKQPDGTMVERQSCNPKVVGSNLGVGKFVIRKVGNREVEGGQERSRERSKDKEAGKRGGEGGCTS